MSSGIKNNCSSCKAVLQSIDGNLFWCDKCEWNLNPYKEKIDNSFLSKKYRYFGRKWSWELYNSLITHKTNRPRFTNLKVIAFSLAFLVYSSLVISVLIGVYLIQFWPNIAAIFGSIGVWGVALLNMRKLRKWPKQVLERNAFPSLYEMADLVADMMKTKRVSGIIIDESYNAYYTEYGFGPWKRKLICIGLLLAETLTDEELLAVLAHETAHGANGDIRRGVFIGGAIDMLHSWYWVLAPQSLSEGSNDAAFGALATIPVNTLRIIVSWIPLVIFKLLDVLLFRQTQEAEYLADRLAAEVAGTKAMACSLEQLLGKDDSVKLVIQQAALARESDTLFSKIESLSVKEKSKNLVSLHLNEIRRGLSLDSTHPPTIFRIKHLENNPVAASFRSNDAIFKEVRLEFKKKHIEVARKIIDEYIYKIS